MTRKTRIRVTTRTTRYDGNGDHAAATRYDNDGYDEDQTVTMRVKDARKTKHRHGEDDGDRKDEEDEDETTKAKTRRTMPVVPKAYSKHIWGAGDRFRSKTAA